MDLVTLYTFLSISYLIYFSQVNSNQPTDVHN